MEHVDLHLHSTASDGEHVPTTVVRLAADAGLIAIALTDHDTVAGVGEAVEAGAECGVRVVPGCEFSVAAPWGELHLLGYFLPPDHTGLQRFLRGQQAMRSWRAREIVRRLNDAGVDLELGDVGDVGGTVALGRPHVAHALVQRGAVTDLQDAFDRYLGWGRPAFVRKKLPLLAEVVTLVQQCGGVTSAAHLGRHVTRRAVSKLRRLDVDAVEALHPSHDPETVGRLREWADELGLLTSGGSDWHGARVTGGDRRLGSPPVPAAWLDALEERHRRRVVSPSVMSEGH